MPVTTLISGRRKRTTRIVIKQESPGKKAFTDDISHLVEQAPIVTEDGTELVDEEDFENEPKITQQSYIKKRFELSYPVQSGICWN